MNELVALPYSPWSEKARWALDHHRIPYEERVYLSPIEEPWLRARLGQWSGTVSVPVLFQGKAAHAGSFEIANFADEAGIERPLIPAADRERIEHWNDLSERGLAAGRVLALERVLTSEEALEELLPKPLRNKTGPVGRAVARAGIRRVQSKYSALTSMADAEEELRAVLDAIQRGLDQTKPREAAPPSDPGLDSPPPSVSPAPTTLLGTFSFADIAATQVLQFVAPVVSPGYRIGRATRKHFGCEPLANEYAALVAWRDAIYVRYRGR